MNIQKIEIEYIPSCTWIQAADGFECTHDIVRCVGVDGSVAPLFVPRINQHLIEICVDCDAWIDSDIYDYGIYDEKDISAEESLMRLIGG